MLQLIWILILKMTYFGRFGGTKNGTSGAQIENPKTLFNTNTPPKPWKNDLVKAFWPLESGVSAILHFLRVFTNFALSTVKMVHFQVKFHPTKRNGRKDIRPPMESS